MVNQKESHISLPSALASERLILRRWIEADIPAFAAMNEDPSVMRFFLKPLTPDESAAMVARIEQGFEQNGFGLWAVELKATGEFAGFVGLSRPTFSAHFTPCVEIGWRFAAKFWGQGLATEGAREVLRDAFERLNLDEIVSFTACENHPSIRVMQRAGMKSNPSDNFDHPVIDPQHNLSRHVLFRLSREEWLQQSI